MEKSKVYFIKGVTKDNLLKAYEALNVNLPGKVAVKLHSGEKGNQNFLQPEFLKDIIEHVNGNVVETNTAYGGARDTTESHRKVLEEHNWSKYFDVDIMDEDDDDTVLSIPNGKAIKENYVGNHLKNYDSILVLAHFKGHPAGGYGGALKQLSIGIASRRGKAWIHSAGYTNDPSIVWDHMAGDKFLEAMADAASSITKLYEGKIAYINIMSNMSVDCDCCAVAENPCMEDIGILASLDPIAIDQACIDLVYNSNDPGRNHLIERIESRNGIHTIEAAAELGFGSREYELIEL